MTTYHIKGGGQRIRQNQDCGINTVKIETKKDSNYPELSGVRGADSFTNEIWDIELDSIKDNALAWAYYPEDISFELV